MGEEAHFREGFRPDHRADRGRLGGIQHLHRIIGRQIGVDLRLIGDVDTLHRMGKNKTVDADHHRHRQFLGELEPQDVQIDRFLIGLGEQLQPSGIAHRHRVGMIVPDIDRRADRTIAQGHHDRQTEARGVIDGLRHEQQPLRRGRGVGPGARGRCANRNRQCGELALDIDKFAIDQAAFPHQITKAFHDMGLRCDGIGADHLRAAQRYGFSHGMRAFDLLQHRGFLRLRSRRVAASGRIHALPGRRRY